MRYAGIVLAGGAARRLSGVDKPALTVGGKPLLARAVHALGGAERVIAVGPRRAGFDVLWTREAVPGTGPVAALAAGLAFVDGDVEAVAVLAADLPGVRRSTVDRLVAAIGGEVVFRGTITQARRSVSPERPWAIALEAATGEVARLDVLEQLLVAAVNGRPVASTPDVIHLLTDSGTVVDVETVRPGLTVSVVRLPADPRWYSPQALARVGPAAMGIA